MSANMTTSVAAVIDLWRLKLDKWGHEAPFSVREELFLAFYDNIARVLFAEDFGTLAHVRDLVERSPVPDVNECDGRPDVVPARHTQIFESAMVLQKTVSEGITVPFPKLFMRYHQCRPAWRRAKREIWAFLAERLQKARAAAAQREKGSETAACVVDMVAEKERAGAMPLATPDILDELYVLLVGGSDTSATTMTWSIKRLARHPDVQRKLHAALVDHVGPHDRAPSFDALHGVAYLDAVVHELARLAPTTGGGVRDAVRDTTILGYPVRKGDMILIVDGRHAIRGGAATGHHRRGRRAQAPRLRLLDQAAAVRSGPVARRRRRQLRPPGGADRRLWPRLARLLGPRHGPGPAEALRGARYARLFPQRRPARARRRPEQVPRGQQARAGVCQAEGAGVEGRMRRALRHYSSSRYRSSSERSAAMTSGALARPSVHAASALMRQLGGMRAVSRHAIALASSLQITVSDERGREG